MAVAPFVTTAAASVFNFSCKDEIAIVFGGSNTCLGSGVSTAQEAPPRTVS
jgi:hypothetical protein